MAAGGRPPGALDMTGLLVGAAAMFAAMYSTQAILPELARDFAVTPSQTGLTISVVLVAVAVAGWVWGPVSDRIGRKRSLTLASGLLALPTLGVALAPSFELLLFFRTVQGLCMPHFDPPHRVESERLASSLRGLWARGETFSLAG